MITANIFNIQKFCVHDGPGIRTTVFMKGCPLSCMWCHNPESQSYKSELMFNKEKCTICGMCEKRCSREAVKVIEGQVLNDPDKCNVCGNCIDFCINNAREIAGREYNVNEVMAEIEKDRIFYDQSGGGVTFSGGEAMVQIDFLENISRRCKEQGISVAIDTCGYVSFSNFERILDYVDLFLYDIKLMDPILHQKYMSKDNKLILDNLNKLSEKHQNINLRIPLVSGINDDDNTINDIINFTKDLSISSVNLLPYHDIARDKYSRLERAYQNELMAKPSQERLDEIKEMFEKNKFKVKIGG